MKVRIKRVDSSLQLPEYHSDGAAGFDIYSRLDLTINPGEMLAVPSNLVVETPEGCVLYLVPRSSLFKKKGLILVNSVGVIDWDFRGDGDEILIQLYNLGKEPVEIRKGERLVQGIFSEFKRADFTEVEIMENVNRGGIGSTG